MLLKFLHYLTARTLTFSVRFQHRPPNSADTSTTWKTHSVLFLKTYRGTAKNASRSCCSSSSSVHGFDRQTNIQCFSAGWDCRLDMSARSLKIPCDYCNPQGQKLIKEERFMLKSDTHRNVSA